MGPGNKPKKQTSIAHSPIIDVSIFWAPPFTFYVLYQKTSTNGHGDTLLPLRANSDRFTAGDTRVNEQIGLTSIQTLFVLEHNRLANVIVEKLGISTDEDIYQLARRLVIAEVQLITYKEFLPALLGSQAPKVDDYKFNMKVNPQIATEFSTVFYRFGHTMLSPEFRVKGLTPQDPETVFTLRSVFNDPGQFQVNPKFVDRVLEGMISTRAQEIDTKIIEDVRSFLFSVDGSATACLDLASLNIQRGREHGIPSYNSLRAALGLKKKDSIRSVTTDANLRKSLTAAYGSSKGAVDTIDPWVGALAEDHIKGGSVGELMAKGLQEQFTRLRDGDPLFYSKKDPDFVFAKANGIINLQRLTLGSVLQWNTRIQNVEGRNVFLDALVV